ncbi:hypothetical protein Tco_1575652 [Tanacetum coccineum]
MDEIQLDDKLHMIKEPVEVVDREVKRLKQSRIPIDKVCWNLKRGPEFTWEHEDQIKKKYLHLFTRTSLDPYWSEIEPDQEGLISIDNSNDPLLELLEFESFHFDPSFPRPPPKPPDVEICLYFEPDAPIIDNFNELNDDQRRSEIDFFEDDDSFTFVIRTFLPFLTYPEVSPLSCSTGSEDTIFDPGIST